MHILEAKKEEDSSGEIALKSPLLGFLKLLVKLNDKIQSGKKIAIIKNLSENFYIIVPEGIEGIVCLINNSDNIEYDSTIIKLTKTNDKSINKEKKNLTKDTLGIKSLMDGTIYLRNSPNEANFVNVGDIIRPGQTLALIEVMKSFYPIKYDGKDELIITKILVDNSSSINAGDLIFSVKKPNKENGPY